MTWSPQICIQCAQYKVIGILQYNIVCSFSLISVCTDALTPPLYHQDVQQDAETLEQVGLQHVSPFALAAGVCRFHPPVCADCVKKSRGTQMQGRSFSWN